MCAYLPEMVNTPSVFLEERGSFSFGLSAAAASIGATWPTEPPAAKRRCREKSPREMWPSLEMSLCPSGCVMCQDRRPLQERHQNGIMRRKGADSVSGPRPSLDSRPAQRQLSLDPKKDYSRPLFVDCSVEYDLPRVAKPPPGAQPLLVKASDMWWDSSRHNQNHSLKNHVQLQQQQRQQQQQQRQQQHQQQRNLERMQMAVASTAPNLSETLSMRSSCVCPSCLGRYWSPPVGATASMVSYPQQQQQQPGVALTLAQGMAFMEQPQSLVSRRSRKRSSTVLNDTFKMSRGYGIPAAATSATPTAAAWLPPGVVAATPGIDLVLASNRLVTAPWMAAQPPLKFPC